MSQANKRIKTRYSRRVGHQQRLSLIESSRLSALPLSEPFFFAFRWRAMATSQDLDPGNLVLLDHIFFTRRRAHYHTLKALRNLTFKMLLFKILCHVLEL